MHPEALGKKNLKPKQVSHASHIEPISAYFLTGKYAEDTRETALVPEGFSILGALGFGGSNVFGLREGLAFKGLGVWGLANRG